MPAKNRYNHGGMNQQQAILQTAIEAARAAGALALARRGHSLAVEQKGFRDFVTAADKEAQRLIIDLIGERFPDHGIIAEEEDDSLSAESDTVWIIDPIDGTSNYANDIPVFAVSIAVAHHKHPLIGVVYDPVHDQLFSAVAGEGSTVNGQPLQVNSKNALGDAFLALDWSRGGSQRQTTLDILGVLAYEVRTVRAVGSAALAIVWIAAGRLDIYFNINLKLWDIAAAGLIVQEAGGQVGGFDGRLFDLRDAASWGVVANKPLYAQTVACLQPYTSAS